MCLGRALIRSAKIIFMDEGQSPALVGGVRARD